ncbi:hypothetical protein IPL68_00490 [Candidatus Saccharibacteria bacterium]|nr:MAG: hypothetical protein IPL68_00490 [Candidatus Saccharibacteria bacterium]
MNRLSNCWQKAKHVTARPGQMSILSVSAQFYCQVSLVVVVPAKQTFHTTTTKGG